jgi:hypothetical protein
MIRARSPHHPAPAMPRQPRPFIPFPARVLSPLRVLAVPFAGVGQPQVPDKLDCQIEPKNLAPYHFHSRPPPFIRNSTSPQRAAGVVPTCRPAHRSPACSSAPATPTRPHPSPHASGPAAVIGVAARQVGAPVDARSPAC